VTFEQKKIKNYLKKLTKKFPDKKLFVLGHSHVLTELKIKEKNYYITDTWRNEYDANKNYTKKQKTYVEIIKDNNEILSHHLKIFP
jgi:IS1 family transposase